MLRVRAVRILLDVVCALAHTPNWGCVHCVKEIIWLEKDAGIVIDARMDSGGGFRVHLIHGRGRWDMLMDEFGGDGCAFLGGFGGARIPEERSAHEQTGLRA